MNGVPLARAPSRRHLEPGPHLGVGELERQQERHGERRARGERRDLAQRGRVRLPRQVHADAGRGHDRGPAGVEAGGRPAAPTTTRRPRSRPARAAASRGCRSRARSGAARFQAWGPGWSTSKTRRREASSGRRWANVSRPAPRMTYWPTPRSACSATRSSMKRARATMRGAERPRALGVHVRPVAPAVVGSRELQADLVLEARAAADRPGRASPATARRAPPCCRAPRSARPSSRAACSRSVRGDVKHVSAAYRRSGTTGTAGRSRLLEPRR